MSARVVVFGSEIAHRVTCMALNGVSNGTSTCQSRWGGERATMSVTAMPQFAQASPCQGWVQGRAGSQLEGDLTEPT
jgi:hypothetical protein